MARTRLSIPFGTLSGKLGDVVFVHRPDGAILRQAPFGRDPKTPEQLRSRERFEKVSRAWKALGAERIARWRAFACDPTSVLPDESPAKSGPGRAYPIFSGLANRRWHVDPSADLSTFEPPTRAFLGDAVVISVSDDAGALVFASSGPNAPDVVTELLAQKIPHENCLFPADKYRTLAFVAFTEAGTAAIPSGPGCFAVAYRFVNRATGQETRLAVCGVVTVP